VHVEIRLLGVGDERLAEEACGLYTTGAVEPAAFLDAPGTALFAAVDGDDVVGCAYGHELVHPDGERTMLLYSLDVAEPSRRRGIGRQLVDAFTAHARDRGCTEVWVLTEHENAAALATYAAAGGTRDPDDSVMFTWRLAPGRHS
jgi:ribosomal protein S18 acetylase RimI-like enzyme